jgi:hypothetical protein
MSRNHAESGADLVPFSQVLLTLDRWFPSPDGPDRNRGDYERHRIQQDREAGMGEGAAAGPVSMPRSAPRQAPAAAPAPAESFSQEITDDDVPL